MWGDLAIEETDSDCWACLCFPSLHRAKTMTCLRHLQDRLKCYEVRIAYLIGLTLVAILLFVHTDKALDQVTSPATSQPQDSSESHFPDDAFMENAPQSDQPMDNSSPVVKLEAESRENEDEPILDDDLRETERGQPSPDTGHPAPDTGHPASTIKRIIYNRVPKCGSSAMLSVTASMSRIHNFTMGRSKIYNQFQSGHSEQVGFCEWLVSLPAPALIERHFGYVNCSKLGFPGIRYINLIRDPIERANSFFSYAKYGFSLHNQTTATKRRYAKTFSECVMRRDESCIKANKQLGFFCGHTSTCWNARNKQESKEALAEAKRAVETSYLVVGLHEDMGTFFRVLERILPNFYSSASSVYKEQSSELSAQYSSRKKEEITDAARRILEEKLQHEYDFYNFVKQRFYSLSRQLDIQNN